MAHANKKIKVNILRTCIFLVAKEVLNYLIFTKEKKKFEAHEHKCNRKKSEYTADQEDEKY